MLKKLISDRRWIFVLMALAIVVPLLVPFDLPFNVSREVRSLYEHVERLPPGTRVLVSSDYDPASAPELYPFSLAIYRHIFRRTLALRKAGKQGLKLVIVGLWVTGPPMVEKALEKLLADKEFKGRLRYGRDFAHLGYKEGKHLVIVSMGSSFSRTWPKDYRGTPIERLPVLDGVRTVKEFGLLIAISAGAPGAREWVQQAQTRHGLKMAASVTAVSAPDYYPYYLSGQLLALVGGMRGSAEYEKLMGYRGRATQGMNSQNMAHLLIILAIILANVIYFAGRWSWRKSQ